MLHHGLQFWFLQSMVSSVTSATNTFSFARSFILESSSLLGAWINTGKKNKKEKNPSLLLREMSLTPFKTICDTELKWKHNIR